MRIHQYDVLRELGQGQFGRVSLAVGEVPGRHGAPGRRQLVAIKSLHDARNADSVRLLRQEFSLLEQVKHRSVVRVFEYFEDQHAVVMEYVHGVTLRTVLDDCGKAREQVFTEGAIEIGCEIADALYQAWTSPADNGEKLRLVHRDLKPENVMLTGDGEVKVVDLGLARVHNTDFAREDTRLIRGTPLYMSPEQARGEELDHRSDLFALGLLLYELLMGRPAYRVPSEAADPVRATLSAIEAGALDEQCRELEAKLPGMGPVVARLLQANPRNRYPNGQDLLVDLRRQLYRDRGSYVKEFVSFYFGSLHPLSVPPDPDAPQGARMSRKTMEERLAEQLVDESGQPTLRPPVPVRRSPPQVSAAPSPSPPPRSVPPPMVPPVAAVPRSAPPKITPRSAAAARPAAPLPDDDDMPVSVRGARPAAAKPRVPVGARSPSETGMLEMVPLGNQDEAEAAADPSATAFFAIPAPKNERPRQGTVPASAPFQAPPSGARPTSAPMAFQPPAPGSAPVHQAPAPAGIGMGGASAIGVGHASGGATPFQVAGSVPTQGSADESRMQSTRVFALIFGALAMVFMAVLAAGAAVAWKMSQEEKPAIADASQAPKMIPPKPPDPVEDEPDAPPPPPKAPRRGGGGQTAATPTPRASATDTVTVTFTGTPIPGKIEIDCGEAFRKQQSLSGGSAIVAGVPTSGDCKMIPKGGVVASKASVRGGRTYTCSISGTTTVCK
ncbi:MAG: serine/threonine protein kinase [Myxococcales bacterium]|nr:serine/threonine protein kinase [Myxococcales bacterium]